MGGTVRPIPRIVKPPVGLKRNRNTPVGRVVERRSLSGVPARFVLDPAASAESLVISIRSNPAPGPAVARLRTARRLACLLAALAAMARPVERASAGDPPVPTPAPATPPAPAPSPGPGPSAAPTGGGVPLDRFFHGAVVGLDGTKVRLKYDFSRSDQSKDWMLGVPWNIAKDAADGISFEDGHLAVRGNVGAYHRAEWEGDLVVTCRLIPDGVKDIGAFLRSPDQVTDYVSYTLVETYFHGWDSKAGGETGMMKFGKQFAVGTGGYTGFRYLAMRKLDPEPAAGKARAFSFGRMGKDLVMSVDDMKQASIEPGNPLRTIQPGFYAVQSAMAIDEIVIEGTLAARYVEVHKIALRTEKPIVPDSGPAATPGGPPPAPVVDPAVTALIAAYESHTRSAPDLVRIVGEATRPDLDRQAAANALKLGPHRAAAAAVDLLYSSDVKARAYGIEIVRALTGKDYGFDPRAGEKARSAAVKKLQADLPALAKSAGW